MCFAPLYILCYTLRMSPSITWKIATTATPQTPDEVIATILQNRKIEDETLFFETSIDAIFDEVTALFSHQTIQTVLEKIMFFIENSKPIFIHGDYDVDGISATAILWEAIFLKLGYQNVFPFIPHRTKHGYGVSSDSLDDILKEANTTDVLVITVDCGITGKDAVEYGLKKGFDFIITDHHTEQEGKAPVGVPILHTKELCGAGISWLLSQLLFRDQKTDVPLTQGIDLVALATLADIQPVVGFNRVLIKEGLSQLSMTDRAGLHALYKTAGIENKKIGVYEVGWQIAPRLNAVGRLDYAMDSLRLLCTTNPSRAQALAAAMNELNQERQKMTLDAVAQAIAMVEQNGWDKDCFILVSHDGWHEGILGLIAGRLTEHFYLPTVALSKSEGVYKGSARSIPGFNIVEALQTFESDVISAGGHAAAAGLSVAEESVPILREKLKNYASDFFKNTPPERVVLADAVLPAQLLTLEMTTRLEPLAPHGIGNPRPLFITKDGVVANKQSVGVTNDHLKLEISFPEYDKKTFDAIAFGMGDRVDEITLGEKIDVLYSLEENNFFKTPRVQLKLKDFVPSQS